MKNFVSAFGFCLISILSFAQTNLSLLGHLPYGNNITCSNLTGYTDSLGREYALVGNSEGLSIVAIDTPTNPRELFLVPGATGNSGFWREVREYKGYAYVTTEQNSGIVVVNLKYLPDSIAYHTINPNGMSTSHTIFIDENGIAYVNGTDKGLLFLNLNTNPWNPTYLGKYTNNYVHDCFARNDTMWAACINDGIVKVIDVRNKANTDAAINNITEWATPLNFAHNTWLSDDNKYLFTTDEKPNSTLTCYQVDDLANVTETDKTQVDPGTNTVIHNTYFLNNYCITSYYTYGITIHDVTRKNNLVETGNFDSSPGFSGDGFNGAWGVWPYLPSGNIIISDIETGLWIVKPTYKRAAYLEGIVKDSICQTFLTGVKIEILGSSVTDYTAFLGKYSTGTVDSGTYTIRFSKNGYLTQDVPNVNLKNGILTTINVNLLPVSTSRLVIKTVDATSGNLLPNTKVLIQDNNGVTFEEITTDNNGQYGYCDFVQGSYNFYGGKWGRITTRVSQTVSNTSDTVIIATLPGYYDDFIMNYGWNVNSTASKGTWVKGEPIGTDYNGTNDCNTDNDVTGDFGFDCYVTGNTGGGAGDDDLDNGYTILSSPAFDLTGYPDPYISYQRWFFNDGGQGAAPNDSLQVWLYNGVDSVLIDMTNADSTQSTWVYRNIRISNYLFTTANMQVRFKTADTNPGHLVEAAVDLFQVIDSGATAISSINTNDVSLRAFPNPFGNQVFIQTNNVIGSNAIVEITNALGQTVFAEKTNGDSSIIRVTPNLSAGIYILKLLQNNNTLKTIKLICTN
jgi:choice-of-anchor B domain-containing protein